LDKIRNPFSPGAGSPPPELAGREGILEQARVLFGRVQAKRPEKSLLLTGLRGVGKTVLLNEIERIAAAEGFRTILVEAHEGKPLAVLLAPHLRRLLFDLDRLKGAGDKVRKGLGVLRSFIGAIKVKVGDLDIGLDIEPEPGSADSGDLEVDLPYLFVAVGEAAQERGVAVAILIDEVQYFSSGRAQRVDHGDAQDAAAPAAARLSSVLACRSCPGWRASRSPTPSACSVFRPSVRCPRPRLQRALAGSRACRRKWSSLLEALRAIFEHTQGP
jgi:hypothetical protein